MAKTKLKRDSKQQLGQFMTPATLVSSILDDPKIVFHKDTKVFEPSLGEGAFVLGFIEKFIPLYPKEMSEQDKVRKILENNIYGVEYDAVLFSTFKSNVFNQYGVDVDAIDHNFFLGDFFDYQPVIKFDAIIGNPPFGGSFNPSIEDKLDKQYGQWKNWKIKKETYAFFTVASLSMLKEHGTLSFILSDTFLTISTMEGLRRLAFNYGAIEVKTLDYFSEETQYGMAVLNVFLGKHKKHILFNNKKVNIEDIENTPNYSWRINAEYNKYFGEKKLSDYIITSSGMTIGRNELFLRKIETDGTFIEESDFAIRSKAITLKDEISRARLGKISPKKQDEIKEQEKAGLTRPILEITPKKNPIKITLPNKDYRFYNKASRGVFYDKPTNVIFWQNEGEAVYAFKKSGPWYLHGIGGKPFFEKEGLTWNLIATSIKARYLPSGYILDSGAPIGILKPNVDKDELWFILGWINTDLATSILKQVINHTNNIQSKDIEKMPYPVWVDPINKRKAIAIVKELVLTLQSEEIDEIALDNKRLLLEELYSY